MDLQNKNNLKVENIQFTSENNSSYIKEGIDLNHKEGEKPYKIPYIRVGVDYWKIIPKTDRFGIVGKELKRWKKEEIRQDHGLEYLKQIPQYDDFTVLPSNTNFQQVFGTCYNLYSPFRHTPQEGEFIWSERLMKHVFGDQYDIGMRYLQLLYLHPERMAPILVLVSRERETGKTTFVNWLNMIFGNNMINLSPSDLVNGFNGLYANKNIICLEETIIDKTATIEKLKDLATAKFISVNEKYVSQYKVPFHGKIILTSNNEEKFARIDQEEIRFFIRKLGKPKYINHKIEEHLLKEIPAFLYHLTTLPSIDFSKGRTGFDESELDNDYLRAVKAESRSALYKEIEEHLKEYFYNNPETIECYAAPIDIKKKWFSYDTKVSINYIRHVLKNEFKMIPEAYQRYAPMADKGFPEATKPGTPFRFLRDDFVKNVKNL